MYAQSYAIADILSVIVMECHAIRPKSSKNFWSVPVRDEIPPERGMSQSDRGLR